MKNSFIELALVGATLYLSDRFISPYFAGSEIMFMLKFMAQAAIVLWVDNAYTKGQTAISNYT